MYYISDNIIFLEITVLHAFHRASKQQSTFLPTYSAKCKTMNNLLEINCTRSKITRLLEIKYLQMFHYTCGHRKKLPVRIQELVQAVVVISLDEI